MRTRDFNSLLKSKGANSLKEGYMVGKYNLTDKQVERVCSLGEHHGGCSFSYSRKKVIKK